MTREILIIGGGPAGCSAARLLALWGHQVRLVTRPQTVPSPALPESIPPSCRKLWSMLDVQQAIDAAGFVRATGNTVWWGSTARVEPFADGERGWQVTDESLARVLCDSAAEAGVQIDERLVSDDEASAMPAAFRLDCTGRAGVLARARAGRHYEPDLRTVALTATWRRTDPWPVHDGTHTLIESYADGWAWSLPLADGARSVAVMVDPRTTDLARGHGGRDRYLAEIAKTTEFAAMLAHAEMIGRPAGWDASMYSSAHYVGDDWIVVGDAGSFVDPLSSAGVMKALASGWLAAVVVHTALTRPAMRRVALEFFDAREREVYAALTYRTRRFLAEAAGGQPHPFWSARSMPFEDETRADLHPERLRRDPQVASAFEAIRGSSSIHLRPSATVRIEPRPAVSGREIVLERRLVTDELPAGIRFLFDVDVPTIIEQVGAVDQVPDLYDRCVRQAGPVALPDFLSALATLVARGWLVWLSQSPSHPIVHLR